MDLTRLTSFEVFFCYLHKFWRAETIGSIGIGDMAELRFSGTPECGSSKPDLFFSLNEFSDELRVKLQSSSISSDSIDEEEPSSFSIGGIQSN